MSQISFIVDATFYRSVYVCEKFIFVHFGKITIIIIIIIIIIITRIIILKSVFIAASTF